MKEIIFENVQASVESYIFTALPDIDLLRGYEFFNNKEILYLKDKESKLEIKVKIRVEGEIKYRYMVYIQNNIVYSTPYFLLKSGFDFTDLLNGFLKNEGFL